MSFPEYWETPIPIFNSESNIQKNLEKKILGIRGRHVKKDGIVDIEATIDFALEMGADVYYLYYRDSLRGVIDKFLEKANGRIDIWLDFDKDHFHRLDPAYGHLLFEYATKSLSYPSLKFITLDDAGDDYGLMSEIVPRIVEIKNLINDKLGLVPIIYERDISPVVATLFKDVDGFLLADFDFIATNQKGLIDDLGLWAATDIVNNASRVLNKPIYNYFYSSGGRGSWHTVPAEYLRKVPPVVLPKSAGIFFYELGDPILGMTKNHPHYEIIKELSKSIQKDFENRRLSQEIGRTQISYP